MALPKRRITVCINFRAKKSCSHLDIALHRSSDVQRITGSSVSLFEEKSETRVSLFKEKSGCNTEY